MHFAFTACFLGIILSINAEVVVKQTTPANLKSIPEETRSIEAAQPIITLPPQQQHHVELKERGVSDYLDFIGFYSVGGYCMFISISFFEDRRNKAS